MNKIQNIIVQLAIILLRISKLPYLLAYNENAYGDINVATRYKELYVADGRNIVGAIYRLIVNLAEHGKDEARIRKDIDSVINQAFDLYNKQNKHEE